MRSETFAPRKPIAKRLKKACDSINAVFSGCFPRIVINPSTILSAIPNSIPSAGRFILSLYIPVLPTGNGSSHSVHSESLPEPVEWLARSPVVGW